MARGNSTFMDWRCTEKDSATGKVCNIIVAVSTYNKRNNDKIMKEKRKFCPSCRKHVVVKRKDTSKGSLGNAR